MWTSVPEYPGIGCREGPEAGTKHFGMEENMAKQVRRTGNKSHNNRNRNRKSTHMMYVRILIVFGAIVLMCALLVGRILFLDRNQGMDYERKVLQQQSYMNNPIPAKRGEILDRNGNKIAANIKMYNLILDPKILASDNSFLDATAEALNEVVGIKKKKLEKIIQNNPDSRYYMLQLEDQKTFSAEVKQEFEGLADKDRKIQGVWFEEKYVRKYPYSSVASNVLGFCSSDNNGIWGIESQYNSTLNGTPGKSYGYYDSDLNLIKTVKEAVNGNNLISTIDINVQGVLEQHMQKFQQEIGSEKMGVIIMNPKNGEIYAMASSPGFDLNNPNDLMGSYKSNAEKMDQMSDQEKNDIIKEQNKYKAEQDRYSDQDIAQMSEKEKNETLLEIWKNEMWRNYCISNSYEPGSTFKPITVAACLDEGTTTPSRTYVCDGSQKVGDATIKCVAYSKGGHGTVNVCQALMESCNDALMQMGADLGGQKFLQYVNAFGFGGKTGIDLPGESTGSIFTEETLRSTQLATSSFGQSQTVTMIQMATAISAAINGGNYYEPHVVKEIQSESGAILESMENRLVRKVITEKTSERLRNYLFKTVEEGTATLAQVKGYEIGGKTGTAEKLPRGQKNYLVSFIGFTPVDDPEVLIYTVIDQPHVEDQAHSTYATQFSSEVLEDILPLLGIYKSSGKSKTDITLPSTKKNNLTLEVPEGGYSDQDYGTAESGTAGDTTEPSSQGNATAKPEDSSSQRGATGEPEAPSSQRSATAEPEDPSGETASAQPSVTDDPSTPRPTREVITE